MNKKIKIAIIHDWLTGMRGGEKCLEVFCELFSEATVFTLLHDKGTVSPVIENMEIRTSFLQKVPGIAGNYRNFLPLFPSAIESFDLSGYDLVLSSSHCAAKGARKAPGALHISYCYTPMRYAWTFFDEYFSEENSVKRWAISSVISALKKWDLSANKRIDHFIAISDNVKHRIRDIYGREADMIYPPADVDFKAEKQTVDGGFYLVVSALAPYKRVDLAVRAFNETGKRLVIIGKGTEQEKLKRLSGGNISFLGWVSDEELRSYYVRCSALIFPGVEDFGIVPVEAQAHGKPVIAYASGGALETVIPLGKENPTGVFFSEQAVPSLNRAIAEFEKSREAFIPEKIKENALRFNRDRFKREIQEYIENKWRDHASQERFQA
ncbi:MAG: glycosyltransferase [Candidatus Omnitrophota bacterium]